MIEGQDTERRVLLTLDSRIVFIYEVALNELNGERGLADTWENGVLLQRREGERGRRTTTTDDDEFVLPEELGLGRRELRRQVR